MSLDLHTVIDSDGILYFDKNDRSYNFFNGKGYDVAFQFKYDHPQVLSLLTITSAADLDCRDSLGVVANGMNVTYSSSLTKNCMFIPYNFNKDQEYDNLFILLANVSDTFVAFTSKFVDYEFKEEPYATVPARDYSAHNMFTYIFFIASTFVIVGTIHYLYRFKQRKKIEEEEQRKTEEGSKMIEEDGVYIEGEFVNSVDLDLLKSKLKPPKK